MAQPKAYVFVELEVTNPEGFRQEYMTRSGPAVQAFGGQFLVRGGQTEVVHGEPGRRFVLVGFDGYEQARAFAASPQYQEAKSYRDKHAKAHRFVICEGAPAAPQAQVEMATSEHEIACGGRRFPAMLWKPARSAAMPPRAVLLGHGGSQYRAHPGIVGLAQRFVDLGLAAVCIDGPIHGSRRSDGLFGVEVQGQFAAMWRQEPRIDEMVADWQATLEHLTRAGLVDAARFGWWGVSMGTAYGVPLCAAEPRIGAAVLGMWGQAGPDGQAMAHSARLAQDAGRIRCPVLFQQKWDDQFFSREGHLELFTCLGTADKWLKVYPGAHVPVAGEQLQDGVAFLADRLAA